MFVKKSGAHSGLQKDVKTGTAHLPIQEIRPVFHKRHVFRPEGGLPEGSVGAVLRRAHHPRHIAQGGTLQLPFAQGPRRLALEVEDDKILSGGEELPEMVIAVDADLARGCGLFEEPLFARKNLRLGREDLCRFLPNAFR